MTELKRTYTEEKVYGYQAKDGTIFTSKEQCEQYEESARCAAAFAAQAFEVRAGDTVDSYNVIDTCCEETVTIYDVTNAEALHVINTYLDTFGSWAHKELIDPKYIGKRVAVHFWYEDAGYVVLGSHDELIERTLCKLNEMFEREEVAEA